MEETKAKKELFVDRMEETAEGRKEERRKKKEKRKKKEEKRKKKEERRLSLQDGGSIRPMMGDV